MIEPPNFEEKCNPWKKSQGIAHKKSVLFKEYCTSRLPNEYVLCSTLKVTTSFWQTIYALFIRIVQWTQIFHWNLGRPCVSWNFDPNKILTVLIYNSKTAWPSISMPCLSSLHNLLQYRGCICYFLRCWLFWDSA